jgi:hypothetical protein
MRSVCIYKRADAKVELRVVIHELLPGERQDGRAC